MTHLSLSWQPPARDPAAGSPSPACDSPVDFDAARFSASGGRYAIDLPGCARFEFGPRGGAVEVRPRPGRSAEEVEDVFRGYVLPRALHALGHEVLHASANVTPQGVVAWCAATGAGKSTLAYGLSRHGFPVWSDDLLAWTDAGGRLEAEPLAHPVRLRPESARFFGVDPAAPAAVLLADGPATLAAIGVVQRISKSARVPVLDVRRLSPTRAFADLLPHAFCFDPHDQERWRRAALRYLGPASRIPVWEIRLQPGWDKFHGILERLGRALGSGSLTAARGG